MKPFLTSRLLFPALLVAASSLLAAQEPATASTTFDPRVTFAPLTLSGPVNAYRSSNGAPGPSYWQNEADYEMHASIDTDKKILTNSEIITYTNNSPDTLTSLWIHLEQNTYREDSRAHNLGTAPNAAGRQRPGGAPARDRGERGTTQGIEFDSVQVEDLPGHLTKADYIVADTRMQLRLASPLKPKGAHLRIHIKYHYTIPGVWGGRTSWGKAEHGEIYDMAQWYPRMAVYDDLRGWDTLPYIGSEFYLEYGHFDYFVTVPANMIVAGSGELVNASEVLSKPELTRLAEARKSDKTVIIRSAEDVTAAVAAKPSGTKTWHFEMDNTRDVSFSASAAFLWDAARINIPASVEQPAREALAQSVYPIESAGAADWARSTQYLKDSVEHFSARWYPYPYPNAINVAGPSDGMEYPGILFDGTDEKGKDFFAETAHEIGHTWFPMILGFNERRNAWMDEGFNTYIDIFESDEFNHGEFSPKRDPEYAPGGGDPADEIAKVIADPEAPVILTRADAIHEKYRHPVTYFKSAFGLTLLREDILGPERFDFAFRKFIRDWAFKHPSPSDFFRAMESEGGEDLSYFWRGWYFNNWQLDLAVTDAQYVDGDPAKGLHVTVANRSQLVLPATLRVELQGGEHVDVRVPAETWMLNVTHTFTVNTTARVKSVTLDPEHHIPDSDRSNNTRTLQ